MKEKKLYLVQREVYAANISEALHNSGTVYKVEIAAPEYQPSKKIKPVGFTNGTQKSKKVKRTKNS